ncbi:hypothetical protein GF420_05685, partial [candidate division GN15 bacterium]|nr:hypothetical protein [candidate division GN15 bacterium]
MNKLVTTIVTLTLVLALGLPAVAKKPAGALISSAKIEIVSGDLDRYKEAEKLLQEAFDLYGPIAEGLFLLNQMQIDYIERTADPNQKREYARAMVKWQDSLRTTCNNEEVKDKY